jgi:hypothetical protein
MTISYDDSVIKIRNARNGSLKDLGELLQAFLDGVPLYIGGVAVTVTAAELNDSVAGLTATAAEINAAADVSSRLVAIADDTAYTVLAANSGKTHVIAELASSITIDLPAAAAGLEYTFIMGGFATEGQNWVFDTGAAANFYLGGLQFLDSDEPGSGSTLVPVYPDGNSNDIMTIITPQAGTKVYVICDGTNWFVNGVVFSATAPTFAD